MSQQVTSVNLSVSPFASSCDSTRLNMAAKQFSQSLTHENCEIPYVVNNEWSNLSYSSSLGIKYAKKSGSIIYNDYDIIIIQYDDGKFEVINIPPIKSTTSIYASRLRNALQSGSRFNEGDIIYEYDAFNKGIPSSGYNVPTMYCPFFGYNHEDSLVISEDFAERARHRYTETICIPITEFTLFSKLYNNNIKYFPEIGEHINGEVICSSLLPRNSKTNKDMDLKTTRAKVINMLQSMNLSDLINMKISGGRNGFSSEKITSNIENGVLTGFKIHKIKKDVKLIDQELQAVIDKLYTRYNTCVVLNVYNDLNRLVNTDFSRRVIKEHFLYTDRNKIRKNIDLTDAVYILEFEISKEACTHLGDKMSKVTF